MDRPLRLITANPVDQLARTVEALLVVASAPLSAEELAQAADDDSERVEPALGLLSDRFREGRSGIVLEHVAGGYAFRASREAAAACARLFERPVERGLSQAALETLSIVAYLGPCSRPEIARIRGVAADSAVAGLLERGLIAEAGRDEGPAVPFATGRRRSSSASSGSRAPPSCRGSTTWASRRRRSASACTRSRSARRPDERQVTVCYLAEVAPVRASSRPSNSLLLGRWGQRGDQICQEPPRSTGTRSPSRVIPSTSSSFGADHEIDMDAALVHALAVGVVLDRERVGVSERDVAGGVLVQQSLVEHRAERADPAFLVDEGDLAEP